MIKEKDAQQFPRFMNHDSAREFLRNQYGEEIVLYTTDPDGPEKVYLYHYVLEVERYLEWRNLKMQRVEVDDEPYLDTFQLIEINDRGKIIVHQNQMTKGTPTYEQDFSYFQ